LTGWVLLVRERSQDGFAESSSHRSRNSHLALEALDARPVNEFAAVRPISPSLTACDSALRKIMLSPEQARAFLDAAKGERLEALYTVALSLGVQMGEA
jgi:hypothetical protein